jgi:hypothetical protein
MNEAERLRMQCHEILGHLRSTDLEPRVWEILDVLVARMDRLETGEFPPSEVPTKPERKQSGAGWNADAVKAALDEGKKTT